MCLDPEDSLEGILGSLALFFHLKKWAQQSTVSLDPSVGNFPIGLRPRSWGTPCQAALPLPLVSNSRLSCLANKTE
jgi:hypothetical protein